MPLEALSVEDGHVPRSPVRVFAVISALYLALFISAVNTTIVSTALPTIANHFHSATGYVWVGAAYILADTATGPVATNLSEIWGRKVVLLASVALFMIASLVCALSTSMNMLIVGRAFQGSAAGAIMLLVSIVFSDMFDMRRRTLYLGTTELIWAVSGAVGPVLGGVFAEYAGWRWIWYANIITGGVTFVVLLLCLDVHNPRTPIWRGLKAVDWMGSGLLLAVTVMVLFGLNLGGETNDWKSIKVLVMICVGVAASAIFFFVEAKFAANPVMPLGVFRSRSNTAAIVVGGLHFFALIGPEFYLPLFYQSAKLARPIKSGLYSLPFVFLESIGGASSGIFIHRTGRYNILLWIGALSMTLGFGLLIDLKPSTSLVKIIVYQCIGALGSGLLIQPPLVAIQANVAQEHTATATSTLNFVRGLAQAIGIVVGGVVFQSSMNIEQISLRDAGLSHALVSTFSGENAQANVGRLTTINDAAQRHLVQVAYAWSLRNAWVLYTAVAAITIVGSYFVGTHPLATEQVETRTGLKDRDQSTTNPSPEQGTAL